MRGLKLVFVFAALLLPLSLAAVDSKTQAALKTLEQAASGYPVSCYDFVHLFTDGGQLQISDVRGELTLLGQRKMFDACEKRFINSFAETQTFIPGRVVQNNFVVAFDFSLLTLTPEHCRMVTHGFATVTYDNTYKITNMRVLVDSKDFVTNWKACQLPGDDDTTHKADL